MEGELSAKTPQDGASEDYQRIIDLLWGESSAPRRGPKPSLNVEQIAWAAIAIADSEGLEAVSMQRVAGECGVTTMALYRYVPGKGELIALMLDIGLGAPPHLDATAGGWRPRLEAWAGRLWATFQQHPWSLAATAPMRLMGPNELGWFEVAVNALSSTGLDAREMVQAVITVLLHVRGMAYYAIDSIDGQRDAFEGAWGAALAGILRKHRDDLPALATAASAGAFGASNEDEMIVGLTLVLDGIGMRIAERAAGHDAAE